MKLPHLLLGSLLIILTTGTLVADFFGGEQIQMMDKPAADFEFTSFNGGSVRSEELKNKVIVLDFWDSHCGPCLAATPDLEKLQRKFANRPEVKILCVDVGWTPLEKEKEFVQKKGYTLDFVYDEKGRNESALGFGGAGFLIVIDRRFHIRMEHIGHSHFEDFVSSLSKNIEQLLSER